MATICNECGYKNPETARICESCGAELPKSVAEDVDEKSATSKASIGMWIFIVLLVAGGVSLFVLDSQVNPKVVIDTVDDAPRPASMMNPDTIETHKPQMGYREETQIQDTTVTPEPAVEPPTEGK
ncbi:MAG: hypothetical protein GMKNLPBB_02296 [Myxococcota bacterium]|nr:hypothetical protein [Myxococcota bacterium]